MGSHFHDWIDYNGVTFLVELLEWGYISSRVTRMGLWMFVISGMRNHVVSRGLKTGRFAIKKWFLLLF